MKTSFGGKIMKENPIADEIIFIRENNKCKINGTPENVFDYGIIGWVSLSGKDNWYRIDFNNKTFISPIGKTGDKLYVRYSDKEVNMNIKEKEIYNILNRKLGKYYNIDAGFSIKPILEAYAKQFFPNEYVYCESIVDEFATEKTLTRSLSFQPTDTIEDLFQGILVEVGMRMCFKNTGIEFVRVTGGSITVDLD